jgi:Tfp pilus assembly major pilin PilA
MKKRLQNGFAHLGLIVLLVIVLAVVVLVYQHVSKNSKDTVVTSNSPAIQVQTIKSKADLTKAESELNNENVDGDLNPGSLNQDVNSLL